MPGCSVSNIRSDDVLHVSGRRNSIVTGRGMYTLCGSIVASIFVKHCFEILQIAFPDLFRELSRHRDNASGGPSPLICVEGGSNGNIVRLWIPQINKRYAAIGSLKVAQITLDNNIVHEGKHDSKNAANTFTASVDTLLIGNTKSMHCKSLLSLAVFTN